MKCRECQADVTSHKMDCPRRGLCEYSARHLMQGIPATTTVDCGPLGAIPSCQRCADFYERNR